MMNSVSNKKLLLVLLIVFITIFSLTFNLWPRNEKKVFYQSVNPKLIPKTENLEESNLSELLPYGFFIEKDAYVKSLERRSFEDGREGVTLTYETKLNEEIVKEDYIKNIQSLGWKISEEKKLTDQSFFILARSGKEMIIIQIGKLDQTSNGVTISYVKTK